MDESITSDRSDRDEAKKKSNGRREDSDGVSGSGSDSEEEAEEESDRRSSSSESENESESESGSESGSESRSGSSSSSGVEITGSKRSLAKESKRVSAAKKAKKTAAVNKRDHPQRDRNQNYGDLIGSDSDSDSENSSDSEAYSKKKPASKKKAAAKETKRVRETAKQKKEREEEEEEDRAKKSSPASIPEDGIQHLIEKYVCILFRFDSEYFVSYSGSVAVRCCGCCVTVFIAWIRRWRSRFNRIFVVEIGHCFLVTILHYFVIIIILIIVLFQVLGSFGSFSVRTFRRRRRRRCGFCARRCVIFKNCTRRAQIKRNKSEWLLVGVGADAVASMVFMLPRLLFFGDGVASTAFSPKAARFIPFPALRDVLRPAGNKKKRKRKRKNKYRNRKRVSVGSVGVSPRQNPKPTGGTPKSRKRENRVPKESRNHGK